MQDHGIRFLLTIFLEKEKKEACPDLTEDEGEGRGTRAERNLTTL